MKNHGFEGEKTSTIACKLQSVRVGQNNVIKCHDYLCCSLPVNCTTNTSTYFIPLILTFPLSSDTSTKDPTKKTSHLLHIRTVSFT